MAANKIFKRTVFDVDIYGEKYKISKPTGIIKQQYISDIDELNASPEDIKAGSDYEITTKFLKKLGLPEKAFKEMEDEHQLELVLMLLTEKKS